METKDCERCGKKIHIDSNSCSNCGAIFSYFFTRKPQVEISTNNKTMEETLNQTPAEAPAETPTEPTVEAPVEPTPAEEGTPAA